MGPLANQQRVDAMESFVADAIQRGAKVRTGGKRIGNEGFFFEPTVLTDVSREARSGRFSHWSTLKSVYSRIIGTKRVAELSSDPLS
jgi:hypothetical protein